MGTTTLFRDLSPPRRRLLEIMNEAGFGQIEALKLEDGEPTTTPGTKVIRSIKIGAAVKPGTLTETSAIKQQARECLASFDQVGNGLIRILKFTDGLPIFLEMETNINLH